MADFVGPCCCFCSQKCFPPSRAKILSGFLRAMLASSGGQVQLSYGQVGALDAGLKAIWNHFGPCCFGIVENNPKIPSATFPPSALNIQPKQRNGAKTLIPMAGTEITQKITFKALSPVARPPKSKNQGPPSRAICYDDVFCGSYQLEGKSATSTPCTDKRRGRI